MLPWGNQQQEAYVGIGLAEEIHGVLQVRNNITVVFFFTVGLNTDIVEIGILDKVFVELAVALIVTLVTGTVEHGGNVVAAEGPVGDRHIDAVGLAQLVEIALVVAALILGQHILILKDNGLAPEGVGVADEDDLFALQCFLAGAPGGGVGGLGGLGGFCSFSSGGICGGGGCGRTAAAGSKAYQQAKGKQKGKQFFHIRSPLLFDDILVDQLLQTVHIAFGAVYILTADHAGLDLNYQNWPGKSQIVIPLSSTTGGLGTVDTTVISDKEVIDTMREDEDMGIDDRKDLVDIKEREADQAEEKAAQAQQEATKETEKLREEQQELREVQKEATQAQKEAQQAQKEADRKPNDEAAQQKAEEAQQKAEEAQQAVEEQKEVVQEQQKVVEEKQQEAQEQQEIADQKRDEARADRAEIAKDQQQLIDQGRMSDAAGVYGLRHLDDTYSVMVKLNKENGVLLNQSPVRVIRGRTLLPADENFMAIAGTNSGNGAVKVVLLDPVSMEIIAESAERAAENSVLVKDGDAYYAVIQDGGNWLVGKYNSKLQLQVKSKIGVQQSTPISVPAGQLWLLRPGGTLRQPGQGAPKQSPLGPRSPGQRRFHAGKGPGARRSLPGPGDQVQCDFCGE